MQKQKTSKLAIISLIVSLLGAITFVFVLYDLAFVYHGHGDLSAIFPPIIAIYLTLPLSIIAIVLSSISLILVHLKKLKGKKLAIISLIISALTAIGSAAYIILRVK